MRVILIKTKNFKSKYDLNIFARNLIMQTGFNNTNNYLEESITTTGTKLLNKLMVYAIQNACIYAKSAGRENISGTDMIIALKYEAHEFPYRNHIDDNTGSESDSESDYEISADESTDDDDTFTQSYSTDLLVQKMNYYHETWESWEPQTHIETTLKNAVNSAILEKYT